MPSARPADRSRAGRGMSGAGGRSRGAAAVLARGGDGDAPCRSRRTKQGTASTSYSRSSGAQDPVSSESSLATCTPADAACMPNQLGRSEVAAPAGQDTWCRLYVLSHLDKVWLQGGAKAAGRRQECKQHWLPCRELRRQVTCGVVLRRAVHMPHRRINAERKLGGQTPFDGTCICSARFAGFSGPLRLHGPQGDGYKSNQHRLQPTPGPHARRTQRCAHRITYLF